MKNRDEAGGKIPTILKIFLVCFTIYFLAQVQK